MPEFKMPLTTRKTLRDCPA